MFLRNVIVKIVLIGHVYTLIGYCATGIRFFFQTNQDFLYNMVMAGCACTLGEMNAMLTVVFLNEIVSGGGGSYMVWAAIAHGYHSPLVVIDGNLNAQWYCDDILTHHVIHIP